MPRLKRNLQPKTAHAVTESTTKSVGEASEAAFLARALLLGFSVSKPWGESRPYDCLVQFGERFWRIQIKCSRAYRRGQYLIKSGGFNHWYTKRDIDFLVAHIVPHDFWYLIPVEAATGRMLHLNPHGPGRAKYERYREAWCLLDCPTARRGRNDIPLQCRSRTLPARCALCPARKQ